MQQDILIKRLQFISTIEIGDKINVANLTKRQNGWYTSFMRTFIEFESRERTYLFIVDTLNKSFDSVKQYIPNSWKILNEIKLSIKGIANIRETYKDDPSFTKKMDFLLSELRSDYNMSNTID